MRRPPGESQPRRGGSRVPLEAVVSTAELRRRGSRPADYETENRALVFLMQTMARSSGDILQQLVDIALDSCRAHSAGVSILEEKNGQQACRWPAVAGRWARFYGSATARGISPCGTLLGRDGTLPPPSQAEQDYPWSAEMAPPIVEALLIPFHATGEPIGELWVIAHDESRRFDEEDARLMTNLSQFAATAYQMLAARESERSQIARDIAERKRIEEALRASQQDLEDFFENSGTPMHWLAGDETILRVNQAELDLLGYTREEYVGHHIAEFHVDGAAIEDILARLARGETVDKYPARLRAKNGSIKHVAISSSVQFRNGEFVNTRCITLDMTAERCAEAALCESEQRLRALSQTLEQRVEARTAELQRQTARLRRLAGKLTSAEQRERKHLAAILHDGLQQLLVAAKMRLGQARGQIHDPAALAAIEDVTDLLCQAVDSSRNLTLGLRPPVLYEDGLIPALRWLASDLPKLHDLHVVIDAEDVELPLSDDVEVLLFESVRELLFNVAKHAGVKEAAVRVQHQDGHRLRIAVEDEGIGFDVEAVAREEDPQQLGLGLFSIRERLAALGGSTALESSPDAGTRVRLAVPLAPTQGKDLAIQGALSPAAARAKTADPAAGTDCQTRVLVVDDHAIVREGIANVLSGDKRLVVVGEAADGVEAIEAVERRQPDVVLIDMNMPRMNGVEATREIRRRWPEVRIVALSVQNEAAAARTMIKAGATAFVSKSDDASQMIDAVLA